MTSLLLKLAAVLALLAALFYCERYIENLGYTRARAEDDAALQKSKAQAADQLAAETTKTAATQHLLDTALDTQNLKDADHEKTVSSLASRLSAVRLRDPKAAGCGAGRSSAQGGTAAPASSSADNAGQTGGLLSDAASEFLRQLVLDADTVNTAYASCRADAVTIRQLNP